MLSKRGGGHLAVSLIMAGLLISCSSSRNRFDSLNEDQLGFIGDYSKFEAIDTHDGLKTFRYVSPAVRSGIYDKFLLEKVDYFPQDTKVDDRDRELLEEIKLYIDANLSNLAENSLTLVTSPETNTIRLTPRITAIETIAGDIRFRELLPIGAALALARTAMDTRHRNVEFYLEALATDSVSGEFLGGASSREGATRLLAARSSFRTSSHSWISGSGMPRTSSTG